jgi:hypothetical protein
MAQLRRLAWLVAYFVKFAGRQDRCGKNHCAFLEVLEHVGNFLSGEPLN